MDMAEDGCRSGGGSEPPTWRGNFQVQSYEADFLGRATLGSLCRYFQEAAWNHAEALGLGHLHLQEQQSLWVLSRLLVEVERYPEWGDVVKVVTWPRPSGPLLALRDFVVLSEQGLRLAGGSSAWLILNVNSRRPQRLDRLRPPFPAPPEKRALARDPEKLSEGNGASGTTTFQARYSDFDVNHHVNNVRYISWILDSYPLEFHRGHAAVLLEMNFVGETREDGTIDVVSQEVAPGEFYHGVIRADRGETVCRARVRWGPIPGAKAGSAIH